MVRRLMSMLLVMLPMLALARPAPASDDAAIADAVAKLGDPDFTVRERASAELWAAGNLAESALEKAAKSEYPEIAHRAGSILSRIRLGLYSDTPAETLGLVEDYCLGDAATRQRVAAALVEQGNRGLRVLLGLRRFERSAATREAIVRMAGASPHARACAALLLAEGDAPGALAVVRAASEQGESASTRDWAALLLLRGGLNEQISLLTSAVKLSADDGPATRLTYLARARGDFSLAVQAAHQSDAPQLVDTVLVESGDWKQLEEIYRYRVASTSTTLGFTAAFCRLAGETKRLEAALAAIRAFADRHDEEYLSCAECLMLNDRVDDGVALLISHRDYLTAMDILALRLRYKEALDLPVKHKYDMTPAEHLRLRARAITVLCFIGDRDAADQALREVAADNATAQDLPTYLLLADAARRLGRVGEADEVLALAMALPSVDVGPVLGGLGLPGAFPAVFWWEFLRTHYIREPYAKRFARLRALAGGELAPEQVDALADEAMKAADEQGDPFKRNEWLEAIGQTLALAGRADSAERVYRRRLDVSPDFISFQLMGDCQAARGDFAGAARMYEQAWEMDRTRAVPLALRGWALLKAGDAKTGREAIELAHALPLGDEAQRTHLDAIFRDHGLSDDARREDDLILRTGELVPQQNALLSWHVSNARRLVGLDQSAHGDPLAAANSWEQAFLRNVQSDRSVDPWGNVMNVAMIHKARALGLIKTAPDAALREASIAISDTPGDADMLIDLVLAFEQAGRRPEADALYGSAAAIYAKLCEEFPGSGPVHNQMAWTEARCRRNLDDALRHGMRSVELEPKNTANIDTLAEVYFARGEFDRAIAQMNRCVELEPRVPRHREQIERFKAAAAAARAGKK